MNQMPTTGIPTQYGWFEVRESQPSLKSVILNLDEDAHFTYEQEEGQHDIFVIMDGEAIVTTETGTNGLVRGNSGKATKGNSYDIIGSTIKFHAKSETRIYHMIITEGW